MRDAERAIATDCLCPPDRRRMGVRIDWIRTCSLSSSFLVVLCMWPSRTRANRVGSLPIKKFSRDVQVFAQGKVLKDHVNTQVQGVSRIEKRTGDPSTNISPFIRDKTGQYFHKC